LSVPEYQTVPVTCPSCQHRFVSPLLSIIDVGQHPEAKALFLSGRINIAVCPQCGHAGLLSAPLVYHDPEKELLLTFASAELGMSELEQQQAIGEMTNRVISTLLSEKRKGYLLRPRSFLRVEAMIEAVLEADGITPEMLEVQRAKADLLDRLLQATSDDGRRIIAKENNEQIDYEFFQLLALNIELAQADEESDVAQRLLALRGQLLEWTTQGHEISQREEAISSLGEEITREGLLDQLVEAALAGEDVKVETLVSVARPAIDYVFYQKLTARIDASEGAGRGDEAQILRSLRDKVLDLTAQIDADLQQATTQAAGLLERILDSDDPDTQLRANLDQIDELFLGVLGSNLQAAEQAGEAEAADRLTAISESIMNIIQESQPPEIQFVNQLLAADYPSGTQQLLSERPDQVHSRLLSIMDTLAQDLTSRGRQETAQRLADIRKQAAELVQ
jgi:hypothetical protein